MNKFIFIIILVVSSNTLNARQGQPTVGDYAQWMRYTETTDKFSENLIRWELSTHDPASFTFRWDVFKNINTDDKTKNSSWVNVLDLTTNYYWNPITDCALMEGSVVEIEVAAGVFTACFLKQSGYGKDMSVWLGNVPFLRIKEVVVDHAKNSTVTDELQAYAWGE